MTESTGKGFSEFFRKNVKYLLLLIPLLFLSAAFFGKYPSLVFEVFDDSLMYVRYADNLMGGYGISWSQGGGKSYGATSLTYMLSISSLRFFSPDSFPPYFIYYCSVLGFCLFIYLFLFFSSKMKDVSLSIFALFFSVILFSPLLKMHSRTGMETTFGLSVMTLFVFSLYFAFAEKKYIFSLYLSSALVYPTRPDAVLFAVMMPGLLFLLTKRRIFFIAALTAISSALITMAWARIYFGHALPLPFYVKTFSMHSSVNENLLNFFTFLKDPVILLSLFLILADLKNQFSKPFFQAGLSAVIIHSLYFTFLTSQNMGGGGRFYFPQMPVYLILALLSAASVFQKYSFLQSRKKFVYIPAALFIFGTLYSIQTDLKKARKNPVIFRNYNELFDHILGKKNIMTSLMTHPFSRECSVAATEVGFPGVIFPKHILHDMVGLNSPEIVFGSAQHNIVSWLESAKPDLIIMPHPGYKDMINKIIYSDYFKNNYEGLAPKETNFPHGLAINKNSKCHESFKHSAAAVNLSFKPIEQAFPDYESLKSFWKF